MRMKVSDLQYSTHADADTTLFISSSAGRGEQMTLKALAKSLGMLSDDVLVHCGHCGQWAAVKTSCVHCGAPVG
jgi:hypothetical protein